MHLSVSKWFISNICMFSWWFQLLQWLYLVPIRIFGWMIQFRDRFCLLTSNNIYLLNSKNDKVSSYHESAFEPSLFSTDLSERMVFFSHFRNRTTYFSSIKQWPSGKTKEWSVFIFWTEEKVSRIYAMQKWLRITLQWIYARKVCHFKSPDLKSDIRCEWEWRFNYLDYSVSQEIATQIEMPRKWHNKNVLYSTHTHTNALGIHFALISGKWWVALVLRIWIDHCTVSHYF